MEEIIPLEPEVHREEFRQLCIETFTWHKEQLWENYQVNTDTIFGSIPEFTDHQLESYLSLRPPEGIVYLLEVDAEVVGMVALTKLSDDIAELHRMWIRPEHRGRGFGKKLFSKVMETGREFGYSTFRLATPRFAHAAQHVYRSAGFKEIDEYREVAYPILSQYWISMEKRE